MTVDITKLNVKIFADGADRSRHARDGPPPHIAGLTTNPTLMRKAGIGDATARSARTCCGAIPDKPISFEVFCDEFAEMERQANEIAGWGDNVYVKIPVTNCQGETAYAATIRKLSRAGVKLNVTAAR